MKRILRKGVVIATVACLCTLPFGMTAGAASDSTTSTTTSLKEYLENLKNDIDSKIDTDLGNLLNLDLGDVGSVGVTTNDDIDVDLDDVFVDIDININFGNITIG